MSLSININHDNLNEVPTGEGAWPPIDPQLHLQRVDSKGSFGFTRIFTAASCSSSLEGKDRVYDTVWGCAFWLFDSHRN